MANSTDGVPHGIDVSNNQGRIDWDAAATTGRVDFCIAKASEHDSFVDHWLAFNAAACDRLGIPWGSYHFGRPSRNNPIVEANFYVACMNAVGWTGDTPFVLDLEDEDFPPGQDAGWWTLAFVRRVRELIGRKCLIYTYRYYITSRKLDRYPELAEYGLWLASVDGDLGPIPAPWSEAMVWQYDWHGRIAGIAGNVDRNWCLAGSVFAFKRLSDDPVTLVAKPDIPAIIAAGVPDEVTGHVIDPIFLVAWSLERDGRPLAGSCLYSDGKVRQLFENAVLESNGRGEPRRGGIGQALAAIIGPGVRPDWPDVHPLLPAAGAA